jgi:hypothetical protein
MIWQRMKHGFTGDSLPSLPIHPAEDSLIVDLEEKTRSLASEEDLLLTGCMSHTSSMKGLSVHQTSLQTRLSVISYQWKEVRTIPTPQKIRYTALAALFFIALTAWIFFARQPIVCWVSLSSNLVSSTSSPLSVFQIREPVPAVSASGNVPFGQCGRSRCSTQEPSDQRSACCCAHLLMNHSFAWSYGHPFVGKGVCLAYRKFLS